MNKKIFFVLPFVLIAMVLGILSGLLRMGWSIPMGPVAGEHGALMVGSFLGTLICLERIVALKKKWMYVIPIVSGFSLIFFLLGQQQMAFVLLTLGSLGLIYIYIDLIARFNEHYFYIMMIGAVGWAVGNIIMIIKPFYPQAAPWWIVFILLTVFGERLELSKFLPKSRKKTNFMIIAIAVYIFGMMIPYHSTGRFITGAGIMLMAAWLFRYDLARKSSKSQGIHRFTGTLLLAGYFWLIVCGGLMVLEVNTSFHYDAMLHAFFLGFTFSMIFAHAPIIFPGVAGLPIKPFHNSLFIWAAALQLSILIRIVSSLTMDMAWRTYSGFMNALVILLFFINLLLLIITKQRKSVGLQR